MKKLLSLLLIIPAALVAQSVHLRIPAVDSSGKVVTIGTAYFTWGQFKDNSGTAVQGGQSKRQITGGIIDVTLTASDKAGYVYNVLLMSGSTASTFQWRVPAAGATSMAQLNQPMPIGSGNPANAGIGNCSIGQYETGTAAGSTQPCGQVQFSQLGGTLGPSQLPVLIYTVAALAKTAPANTVLTVSDGVSITDCTAGKGSIVHSCQWNGSSWGFYSTGSIPLVSSPGASLAAGATSFDGPFGLSFNGVESARQMVMPLACQASNMYVYVSSTQPSTGSVAITLRKNSTDQALAVTIPASAGAGTYRDITHTVPFAAGDLVSMKSVNKATGTSAAIVSVSLICKF